METWSGGATVHTRTYTNTFTISICRNDEHFFIVYFDSLMPTKINSMLALLDACFFLLVNNGTMRILALSFVDDIAGGLGLVFWAVVNGMNDCRDMIRGLVFERNYFTWKLWYLYSYIFNFRLWDANLCELSLYRRVVHHGQRPHETEWYLTILRSFI